MSISPSKEAVVPLIRECIWYVCVCRIKIGVRYTFFQRYLYRGHKFFSNCRKEAQKRAIHGGVSPAAYHIRNSPGTSFSPSSFGNSSPMMGLAALSPARAAPLYIGGGSVSPAYPFPSQSEAVMGPPAPTKVKKHKKKKHKKKKPGSSLCDSYSVVLSHAFSKRRNL